MIPFEIITFSTLALTLFALALFLTWLIIRAGILSVPNYRSSHQDPVPNGGGLAIVITVFIGFALVYKLGNYDQIPLQQILGLGTAALVLAFVGFLDDLGEIRSFKIKLAAQFLAACFLLYFDMIIHQLYLPFFGNFELGWWAYPVPLIWVVGLINAFNFMDGLDGMAGGSAVIVAGFFGLVTFLQGFFSIAAFCLVLLVTNLGFLVFNFPKAKIFMGDVGSQFLGLIFAAISILGGELHQFKSFLYIMPFLFFHFIFDVTFSILRRIFFKENIFQAHRSHLYQLVNQMGWSHGKVSLLYYGMGFVQGFGVLWIIHWGHSFVFEIFLLITIFHLVYMLFVIRMAKKNNLL